MRTKEIKLRKGPVEVLFSAYHRRILALLLLRSGESFHVREISRLTAVPAGSLHRELRRLAEAGLISREKAGNLVRYQADVRCPIYGELRGILAKSAKVSIMNTEDCLVVGGVIRVSRERLRALAQRYHVCRLVLFGSAARGELGPESDIDLLIEFEPGGAPSLGGMFELQQEFSGLFGGRKVDVATLAILNNPYRRRAIERDMRELYAA
ncbi:MAG: nucleotidyltransferase domain-containing protein [Gammaproteobacteria bacterium]|nr:nucleotidyltransferase domain-containing protein [Gammaproteobacteria bacterium]